MRAAYERLRERLGRPSDRGLTLGAVLEIVRRVHAELPTASGAGDGDDVRLHFHCQPHAGARHACIELVWHWPRPEQLDAPPARLWLRFDVAASERTREVDLRCRDYPHVSAFVSALIREAALDESALVQDLRVEVECEHAG
jgi:hypothetical protein